jgi:hypothetical protein
MQRAVSPPHGDRCLGGIACSGFRAEPRLSAAPIHPGRSSAKDGTGSVPLNVGWLEQGTRNKEATRKQKENQRTTGDDYRGLSPIFLTLFLEW